MFPQTNLTVVTTTGDNIGRTPQFDAETLQFLMVDGANVECTDIAAVKQWIAQMLRTKRGAYAVYGDTGFGISTDDLIGTRSPPDGFVQSELKREITESLALLPTFERADRFTFTRSGRTLVIGFTVYLTSGESTEVTYDVN